MVQYAVICEAVLIVSTQNDRAQRGQTDASLQRLTQGLGSLSVVLGITELIWGGALSSLLGFAGYHWIIRVCGGYQILCGGLILNSRDPIPGMWLRVSSDALHVGTLIYGYTQYPDALTKLIGAMVAVLGLATADLYCAVKLSAAAKVQPVQ